MSESATLIVTAVSETAILLQDLQVLGVPVIWWIVAFGILVAISRLVLFSVHSGDNSSSVKSSGKKSGGGK